MRQTFFIFGIFMFGWIVSWVYYSQSDQMSPHQKTITQKNPSTFDSVKKLQTEKPEPVTNNVLVSTIDLFRDLLARGEYEKFMGLYVEKQGQSDSSDYLRAKELILHHTSQLIRSKQFFKAQSVLNLYLGNEFNDIEALQLQSQLFNQKANYLEAIEALYTAKSYSHTNDSINQIVHSIRTIVSSYTSILRQKKNHLILLSLYQRLSQLEPEYAAYHLGLAEAYMALGNSYDARNALQLALQDPVISAKANLLLNKIETSALVNNQYSSLIPLIVNGDQFIIEATLNNQQTVKLLLDTGATLSIISPGLLDKLGSSYSYNEFHSENYAWFNTVNGRIQAPVVSLDSMTVGDMTIENIKVGVIDVSSHDQFDGLLGMNFLRHFQFFINQHEQVLQLSPR